MNKTTLWYVLGVIIFLIAVGAVYFLFFYESATVQDTQPQPPQQQADDLTEALQSSASSGVQINTNPLGELPETNPVERANPFKNLNTNPFKQ